MSSPRPKLLRAALLFFALSHACGLASMALTLRRGMDPPAFSLAERAAYVASHAATWRLGWLPWRLAALGNLWVGVEFWRWAKHRANAEAERAAVAALGWFLMAAVPEQWAEWRLVTSFISNANGDLVAWGHDFSVYAVITGVWANLGYTVTTSYWMRIAAMLRPGSVVAQRFERALLGAFVLSGLLTLGATLVSESRAGIWFTASSVVNGVAFPSLIGWSLLLWRQLASSRQPITK